MGPKKNKITSSTPAVKNPSATFAGLSENSSPSTINSSFVIGSLEEVVLKQPAIPKVTTWELICKAIDTVGVPRKGASYLAIQKWIINNKENVQINRLKANLKKAIVKALESGLLKRPAISKNVTGLRGYFILIKEVNVRKPTLTQTAKALIGKTKTLKITKPKTATAPKPKTAVKPKSDTEEATKAKPKIKVVKTKPTKETTVKPKAVKSNSNTKETIITKPKTKAVKLKTGTESSSKGKEKAAVKSKPGKSVPKAKALKPIPDSEDLPIPKPKVLQSRVNGVKVPTQGDLNPVQIPKKVPKNTSKPANSTKNSSKDILPRKLYSSRLNHTTKMLRKDLRDTELKVQPDNRKSLKSYSSDTEVEVIKRKKITKVTKSKKIADEKNINEAGPSNVKKRKSKADT